MPVLEQVPAGTAMSCAHVPPQTVPSAALFGWQTPCPSQVSGSVHALSVALPQAVVLGR